MSGPFSNAHLRVPRGFGSVLEGLAREVLREQPEDIPAYAARYFDSLLQQREESGLDPAEWAAELEDRFNNDAFQHAGTSPDKEPASDLTISKEKSNESQTEDELSRLSEASGSSTQPRVSEKLDSTESTDEEDINTTEKFSISGEEGLSEIKSVADRQSDEENNGDKGEDPTETALDEVVQADMEMDENHDPDQHIPQFDSEPSILLSFKDISNVEVTTHELGLTDDGGDQQESETVDKEIFDSSKEENTKNDEAVESFMSSELVDVDVCATELGETQKTTEEGTVQENTDVEEDKDLTPQLEGNAELLQSKQDFTQDSQQEDTDQAQKHNKGERTKAKASYGETNEVLARSENDLDGSVMPKDSLVEISFEDVLEAQGIPKVEGENLVQGASVEIAQNNKLEMQQKEESMELTASSAHQNMSDSEDQLKFETEKDKKESNSEEEEIHATFAITKEKVDTNNSNQNDNDDEKEISVKGVSSSDQPITEAEDEIQEHETDHEDTEEISERILSQNQGPEKKQQSKDVEQDEMADTSGEDEESHSEMGNHEITDGTVEEKSSQAIKSHTSISGKEAEAETFDEDLPLENKPSPRTGQSQPENISDIKEVTSEEDEECMKKMTDSEAHQKSKDMEKEETFSLARSADWTAADLEEEDRPAESEENTTASVNKVDKEECSRPQEEEDIMDIPLDDPEANRAAAKIQAGFRGHMTRKKMKPEDKTEGEEVSSTGDVLSSSQGVSETGRSGAVGGDDTSVPEQ